MKLFDGIRYVLLAVCITPYYTFSGPGLDEPSLLAQELSEELGVTIQETSKALTCLDRFDRKHTYEWDKGRKRYYEVMPKLIKDYNLKIGCEVGVMFGRHSAKILETTEVATLYSVDLFSPEHLAHTFLANCTSSIYADVLYARTKKLLSKWGTRSQLLRESSHSAAKQFPDGYFDFVFIDAGHTYESVKLDLESWYEKVRPGGFLVGDDYNKKMFLGLTKAVNEFFAAKNLHIKVPNPRIWVVQKPELIK